MTLMKGAPLPTFSGTVRSSLRKAALDVLALYGVSAEKESQQTRRGFEFEGQFFAGKKINNHAFSLYFCVFLDSSMADFLNGQELAVDGQLERQKTPLAVAARLCQQIFEEAGKSIPQWSKDWTAEDSPRSPEQSLDHLQKSPDEWLVTTVSCGQGRLDLLFAYQGEWGVSDEEANESLTEARDMTFF